MSGYFIKLCYYIVYWNSTSQGLFNNYRQQHALRNTQKMSCKLFSRFGVFYNQRTKGNFCGFLNYCLIRKLVCLCTKFYNNTEYILHFKLRKYISTSCTRKKSFVANFHIQACAPGFMAPKYRLNYLIITIYFNNWDFLQNILLFPRYYHLDFRGKCVDEQGVHGSY